MLPLQGIKVVDLSTVVFGPLASQGLADLGAHVIKVEGPEGDSTRRTGPAREAEMAALFLGCNRSKRSVVLDLKKAPAQEALHALLAGADVFMHSMRPQKLAALGLDPGALRARFPRLVYASLHGFSEDGPYAGLPAYDDVIQGMSGLAALTAMQTGEARYLPTIAADKTCALFAVQGILAALFQRERTGAGCRVEVPMFESMVAFNLVEHLYGSHFQPPADRMGYPRVLTPWRRPWRTSDGLICMMPYTDVHWVRFFSEVGRPDLATDPRFGSIAARTAHIAELLAIAADAVARNSTEHWLATCGRLEIPASRVNSLDDLLSDPHLSAIAFFERVDDARMGSVRFPGSPLKFDDERARSTMAPRLGEHTESELAHAGVPPARIRALIECGAARQYEGGQP